MQSNHILMFIYITLHHLYQWNYTLDASLVLDHNYTIQTRTLHSPPAILLYGKCGLKSKMDENSKELDIK